MMTVNEIRAPVHIQDSGRYGYRHLGIGHAGAMDVLALKAGNLLLGNDEHAAALEIALGSLSVSFSRDTVFCLTGAFYQAFLDELPVHSYWRYSARRGQTLQLVRAVQGMYGYLCVSGGFDVAEILGSRSTDLKAAFGGFQGRSLQAGDRLRLLDGKTQAKRIGIAPPARPPRIRLLPAAEYTAFSEAAHSGLVENGWLLRSDSNRMGYRFDGTELPLRQPLEMLSHAVCAGTVQVPPGGQPIILMADAQTTGGYPKIACVAAADLGHLAQTRFGSTVYFETVSVAEAWRLQQRNQIYLNQIRRIVEDAN